MLGVYFRDLSTLLLIIVLAWYFPPSVLVLLVLLPINTRIHHSFSVTSPSLVLRLFLFGMRIRRLPTRGEDNCLPPHPLTSAYQRIDHTQNFLQWHSSVWRCFEKYSQEENTTRCTWIRSDRVRVIPFAVNTSGRVYDDWTFEFEFLAWSLWG
jgi:hypothetical protein